MPAAFNEVLRFWAPAHAWGRRATKDVDVDGVTVPAGAQIASLFGASNRDPRHHENPDAFLVERNPVDHLSFGYGPHGCAGQGLARLEAHAVIEVLSRRVRRLVIGPEVPRPQQHHPEHRTAPRSGGDPRMRIVLDRPRCEGHGLCEEAASPLMHLDGVGELVLDQEEFDVTDTAGAARANAAVRVCPVAALRLV
ncbi:hypothetical protein GCM10018780_89710 [Streptomyces lanatus]|nr:hypothetical protein GCM10018780_89710 [Streptomyces lanatus]